MKRKESLKIFCYIYHIEETLTPKTKISQVAHFYPLMNTVVYLVLLNSAPYWFNSALKLNFESQGLRQHFMWLWICFRCFMKHVKCHQNYWL